MSRIIDPTERLSETFRASPIDAGPDGMTAPVPVTPPSEHALVPICQLGPCVRYHEIRTRFDAQEPEDGSGGPIYTHPTRTCYPAAGIEIDITEHPVRDCNLWEPRIDVLEARLRHRQTWTASEHGAKEWAEYEASWPRSKPNE
jgi:hypothetical protein